MHIILLYTRTHTHVPNNGFTNSMLHVATLHVHCTWTSLYCCVHIHIICMYIYILYIVESQKNKTNFLQFSFFYYIY